MRGRWSRRAGRTLVVVLALGGPPASAVGAAAGPGPGTYRPPLAAPVADPFRPPPEPWLAGNRGIEYRTVPGAGVGAIGPGTVAFAGPVAGERVVAVDHPDGLRSSYVDLAWIGVEVGQRVAAGDLVGRATHRLHLGVRRGGAYLDPASLWGTTVGTGRVVLVPLDGDGDGGGGGGPGGVAGPPPTSPRRVRLRARQLAGPALGLAVARTVVAG